MAAFAKSWRREYKESPGCAPGLLVANKGETLEGPDLSRPSILFPKHKSGKAWPEQALAIMD
jgi:hypothetical protein